MAIGSSILQLASGPTGSSAKLHPTVLFNICDSYIRRNDQTERVIGTLLGSVSSDGVVDIRNSYAVPHNESSEQVLSIAKDLSFLINFCSNYGILVWARICAVYWMKECIVYHI